MLFFEQYSDTYFATCLYVGVGKKPLGSIQYISNKAISLYTIIKFFASRENKNQYMCITQTLLQGMQWALIYENVLKITT